MILDVHQHDLHIAKKKKKKPSPVWWRTVFAFLAFEGKTRIAASFCRLFTFGRWPYPEWLAELKFLIYTAEQSRVPPTNFHVANSHPRIRSYNSYQPERTDNSYQHVNSQPFHSVAQWLNQVTLFMSLQNMCGTVKSGENWSSGELLHIARLPTISSWVVVVQD